MVLDDINLVRIIGLECDYIPREINQQTVLLLLFKPRFLLTAVPSMLGNTITYRIGSWRRSHLT